MRRPANGAASPIAARRNFPRRSPITTKSLEIKPDPDVYAERGYTYVTYLQEYEKGIADYEKALQLNPNDADTKQRLRYARAMLSGDDSRAAASPAD
jgi:tetratricopeptide (TPR) repeat protein